MLIFWLWIFSFIYKRKNFFTNKVYIRYHDVMTGPNNIYLQKMNIHPIQILGGKIILFFNKSIYLPRKKICFRPMIKVNLLWICYKKKKRRNSDIQRCLWSYQNQNWRFLSMKAIIYQPKHATFANVKLWGKNSLVSNIRNSWVFYPPPPSAKSL